MLVRVKAGLWGKGDLLHYFLYFGVCLKISMEGFIDKLIINKTVQAPTDSPPSPLMAVASCWEGKQPKKAVGQMGSLVLTP